MKRFISLLCSFLILLTSCSAESSTSYQKYRYHFFGTFDTLISLVGYTEDAEQFEMYAGIVEKEMTRYHKIFDQYHPYDGVNNLYAVNQNASKAPTPAEPELIDLLLMVKQWRHTYRDVLNPAMGSVLTLWHDARTDGTYLPSDDALHEAALHTDFDKVSIDEEKQTVFFEDDKLSLDLGAVAKGYSAELVFNTLKKQGWSSFILNAGGNVICGSAPLDGRSSWKVAVEDLDGVSTKEVIAVNDLSVVTSGDYQRFFTVDGQQYHHLIDPVTLYPAHHMRAVTIVTDQSGLADFLSTTAFLLPYEESRALIESLPHTEAMWTLLDESVEMTDGFHKLAEAAK